MTNEDKAKILGISPEIANGDTQQSDARDELIVQMTQRASIRNFIQEWVNHLMELSKPKTAPTYEEDPEYHNRARRVIEWLKLGQQMQAKEPPRHPEIMALLYHEKSQAMFELARDWNIYCESGECERPDVATWNLLFPWDDWEMLMTEGRLYPVNVGDIPASARDIPADIDFTFEFEGNRRLPAPAVDTRFFNYAYSIPKDPPKDAPDPLRLDDGTRLVEGLTQSVKEYLDKTPIKPMFQVKDASLSSGDQAKGYNWSLDIEIMPTTMIVDPLLEREYDQELADRLHRETLRGVALSVGINPEIIERGLALPPVKEKDDDVS